MLCRPVSLNRVRSPVDGRANKRIAAKTSAGPASKSTRSVSGRKRLLGGECQREKEETSQHISERRINYPFCALND